MKRNLNCLATCLAVNFLSTKRLPGCGGVVAIQTLLEDLIRFNKANVFLVEAKAVCSSVATLVPIKSN